jgi:hypothetical protein
MWQKIALIGLCVLLVAVPSWAGEKWDKADKALFGTFITLNVLDALQTNYIFDNPDEFREKNPILRSLGEDFVVPYFAAVTAGAYLVADQLKPKHRKTFLTIMNAVQIYTVGRNVYIGVGFSF